MIIPPLCSFLILLPLVAAQYGSGGGGGGGGSGSGSGSTTTASASGATQTVTVGEHGFSYSPNTLSVMPGDKVEFMFTGILHSVSEAAFGNPCHPKSSTSFFSGFQVSPSVFTLAVNDTNPIWFYCGRPAHCQAGMVGVINPPTSGPDTLAAFRNAAAKTSGSTVPATAQGGILSTKNSTPSKTSPSSTGSTSTGTSTGSANAAEKVQLSTDISVMLIFTSLVAIFLL